MADRPGEAHELLTDLRLMGETPTHYGQEEHGEVHLEALARVAQLEEALRAAAATLEFADRWCPVHPNYLSKAADAARAVLAGGTPPPGTADAGDSRAVVAEDAGLSGDSE